MELKKIAVFSAPNDPVCPQHQSIIQAAAPNTQIIFANSYDEMYAQTNDIDAMVMWPFIDDALVEFCRNAPSLKWIHCFISGVDAFLNSPLNDLPITITSTKGIHGPNISDHALAYIFSFLRQFPNALRAQLQRRWANSELKEACQESCDQTIGIVGVGAIGSEIARKCKLLGMRVIGAKRTPIESEWLDACYPMSELDKLLEESDFVILILPLTKETENLMGAEQFAKMKNSAYLINLARGAIVDHEALVAALDAGELAGAGLDIFTKEPLDPDSPLWLHPKVLITHHTAPGTPHYMDRAAQVVAENIRRYLADEPLLYVAER